MKEIKICSRHTDFQVPLIWTFAFIGYEYWCPYCAYNGSMFGSGKDVELTPELKKRKKQYKKFSKDYLGAKSTFICSSLKWKGKRISPKDLPDEEKKRCHDVIDNWKYEVQL